MVSVIRELLGKPGRMRRAFFFWTVRDMSSFEWFNNLMEEIYEQDINHVLEVRHFLTSAKRDDRDIGAVLFHYAANAIHADTRLDIVLGHRSRHQVQVGRPDWDAELNHVVQITKEMGENDCGVFLCGPEVMAEAVAASCTKLSKKESDFHLYFAKETF
jgi:ferredoxin-NADP reductase